MFAFLVRLVIALGVHIYSLLAGFEGFYPLASGADDRFYYWAAISLLWSQPVENLPNIYPSFLSLVYQLVGPTVLGGKLVNVFFGSIAVYYGVLLAYELSNKDRPLRLFSAPNLAGLFLTIYPSSLFYSGQLLKDPIILALGSACLFWFAKLLRKPRMQEVALLLAGLLGLYLFRGYASVALLLAFTLYSLAKAWKKPFYLVLTFIIAFFAPISFGWGPLGLGYLGPLLQPEKLSKIREEAYSIGGSAADIALDFSNPIVFLITYAYSFVTALLGPLPWQVKSPLVAVAFIEAVPIWVLLILALIRRPVLSRDPRILFLLIFVLIYIGGLALVSDNIGANTRLRMLPWSALLVFLALRLERSA